MSGVKFFSGVMGLFFLVLFSFFVLGAVGDGSCAQFDSVCYGSSLGSDLGHGAVELCGDCYRCGVSDGVCPEDFFNGTHYAVCSGCADPDCLVNLTGRVYDEDNPSRGLNDVVITAQVLHAYDPAVHLDWKVNYTTRTRTITVPGEYWFMVPRGEYKLSAEKFGYETRLVDFPYSQGAQATTYTLNFGLANGSCHVDCTGYHYEGEVPRCRAACDGFSSGVDQCSFQSGSPPWDASTVFFAAEECDGLPVGSVKVVSVNPSDESQSFVVNCCNGDFEVQRRPHVVIQQGDIKNLVMRTIVAEMEGEAGLVKVRIISYDK